MTEDQEFDINFGFASGLLAIKRAKEVGHKITETDRGFYWDGGFVEKSFIEDEANLSKELYTKFAKHLLDEV